MNPQDIRANILDLLLDDKRSGSNGLHFERLLSQLQAKGQITEQELNYNLDRLKDEKLIESIGFQQQDYVIIWLTNKGEAVARKDFTPSQPAVQYTTYNFTNSPVGAINHQGTIHDLHVTMGSLQGYNSLNNSLNRMIEAVTTSNELTAEGQQEILDNLSLLTDELTKPAPKRRLTAMRTLLLGAIPAAIGHAADVLGVWESDTLQEFLKAFGFLSPS